MNNSRFFLLLVLFCQSVLAKAQPEFLTTVDPGTGLISLIDSLPGVNYIFIDATAFDKNNKRYVFGGIDFDGQNRLFCIDATNGAKLSEPFLTANVGELHYDHKSNKLYGLYNNGSGGTFVVQIDISTADIHLVKQLPVSGFSGGSTCFDSKLEDFYVIGSDKLYAINVITGIIKTVPLAAYVGGLQFDESSDKIFGLTSGSTLKVVQIDPASGQIVPIISMPSAGYSSSQISFDEFNHVFTFESSGQLFTVDVNAGAIIYNPTFPVVDPGENVIELHYDDSNGILYALHWNIKRTLSSSLASPLESSFQVFPNPVFGNQSLQVFFENAYVGKVKIEILGMDGRLISRVDAEKRASRFFETLPISENHPAQFLVRVSDGKTVFTQLIMKF